jgi:histidinol-phosphate aminotransferase
MAASFSGRVAMCSTGPANARGDGRGAAWRPRPDRAGRGRCAAAADAVGAAAAPGAPAPAAPAPAAAAAAAPAARFVRAHLLRLAPYTPIEPFEVISARLGRAPEDIVKLDANENPYGPPPEVLAALGAMRFPHVYPDPETRALRAALAAWHGVDAARLLVGCGADELIDLLMRVVLDPGDAVIDCPPTFTMYRFDADVNAARVLRVPRGPGFALDVPGIAAAVAAHAPKVVFLTSPNNPDGSLISDAELEAVLALPVLVVLDEAYIEFAGVPSRISWVGAARPNLAVLRTFSKCAALAGLRVGYGAFPPGLSEYMWAAKQPYNVSAAAEVAALAALSNMPYLDDVRDRLVAERGRLAAGLAAVPFLEPAPSAANFVLCRVTDGRDARGLRDALAERYGIMVRHYATAELSGYVRVSVGKPEHTDALLAALAELA